MPDLTRAYFIRTADEDSPAGRAAPSTSEAEQAARPAGGGGDPALPAQAIGVQFNPTSLQYGLQINSPQPGAQPGATQHAARAEATLELDLVFDTTPEGHDVRGRTVPLRALALGAEPGEGGDAASAEPPPKVAFVWGSFRFEGTLTGFRETLDFFSAEGVPLRAGVHLSMRGTQNSQAWRAAPRGAAGGLGSAQSLAMSGLGALVAQALRPPSPQGLIGGLLGGGLGPALGSALANLGRQDAAAAREAAAALGLESTRGGRGGAVAPGGRSDPRARDRALRQLGQSGGPGGGLLDGLSGGGLGPALGEAFGFGGRSEQPASGGSSAGSGQRARLGSIDFGS